LSITSLGYTACISPFPNDLAKSCARSNINARKKERKKERQTDRQTERETERKKEGKSGLEKAGVSPGDFGGGLRRSFHGRRTEEHSALVKESIRTP